MDLRSFHLKRRALQLQAVPAARAELLPLERSLRGLLLSSHLFEDVEVSDTENPDGLVIAMCRFRSFLDEGDVAQQVERIWDERVRHPFWEAHGVRIEPDQVEFRAATRADVKGAYVTLHLGRAALADPGAAPLRGVRPRPPR